MSATLTNDPGYCDLGPGGQGLYAMQSIMLVITTALVLVRMYLRLIRTKEFGWDDGMLLLGYALMIASMATNFRSLALGFGRHSACQAKSTSILIRKLTSLSQFLGIYSGLFSRLATALLILRVFAVSRSSKYFVFAYSTVQVLVIGITGILTWFQCTPSQSIWNPSVPHTCWSSAGRQALADINGVVSVLCDLIAIVIPTYVMWFLRVPNRLKVIVVSSFALSLGPIACAIARMVLHYTLVATDFSYDETSLSAVFTLEVVLLVACASLPTLPGIFRKKDKTTGTTSYEMPLANKSDQHSTWTDASRSTASPWISRNYSSVSSIGQPAREPRETLYVTSVGLTVR